MGRIPSNHRLAERFLIQFVESGEWEIDSLGQIWMLKKQGKACVRKRAEKEVSHGYLMVRRMINGFRHAGVAHRLVWQYFHGDIPAGMCINHKNGVKNDNRPENLEVATYSENISHAYAMNLADEHGERNPAAKLLDSEIQSIRLAYMSENVTQAELATRYNVAHQTVSKIVRGERRQKQDGPTDPVDHRKVGLRVREFPR